MQSRREFAKALAAVVGAVATIGMPVVDLALPVVEAIECELIAAMRAMQTRLLSQGGGRPDVLLVHPSVYRALIDEL